MGTYLLVTPQPDELYHFGIKGMKWGIRRFQPYQKGERVKGGKEVGAATKVKQRPSAGNIIERYKANKVKKKRVEALKKAQATRKANLDNEAAKKKAIESGTVEDLAKFKGQLTNEEYTRAFMRLQNEKKLSDMVAANQKTVWDKIDKGMQIVQKLGGYANTVATAKENFDKLDNALHKKEKDEAKDKKEAAKKAFMNTASYEDLVKRANDFGLDTKDYNMVVARLKGEKDLREKYNEQVAASKAKEAEDAAFRKEQNAHAREQANNLKNGLYKIPPQAASKPSNDSAPEQDTHSKPSNEPAPKRDTHSYNQPVPERSKHSYSQPERSEHSYNQPFSERSTHSYNQPVPERDRHSYNQPVSERSKHPYNQPVPERSTHSNNRPGQLLSAMSDRTPSSEQVSSGKRIISGFSAGNSARYNVTQSLDFGSSKVTRASAQQPKPTKPSKVVTDTRDTVAYTQAQRAKQKESTTRDRVLEGTKKKKKR